MYALCDLYARPYDPQQPVVCVDEKSKQLLAASWPALEAKLGQVAKEDYEYKRQGTRNIFVAVEPKGGHREVAVAARRTKADFFQFICGLLNIVYATVQVFHLVMDNLNTHFRSSFEKVLGKEASAIALGRIEFHYTPKHASWLNMAELEIGIMEKQCTGRQIQDAGALANEIVVWQHRQNVEKRGINWTFTREKADEKLGRHYIT